jgi:hypothetical protein
MTDSIRDQKEQNQIDYHLLLLKYMYHVVIQEGVDFIGGYKQELDYFSDLEYEALQKASVESEKLFNGGTHG